MCNELKKELRKNFLEIRKSIKNKDEKSLKICEKISELDIFKNAKTIAIYKAKEDEVNVDFLFDKFNGRKMFLVPTVTEDGLKFSRIYKDTVYKTSNFGILEPLKVSQFDENYIDVIIVPAIAINNKKYRIGYGAGYYDIFLKNKKIFKICVVFDECLIKNDIKFYEKFDVRADLIVTENEVK